MHLTSLVCNSIWWTCALPGALAYRRAAGRVESSQRRILARLVDRNRATRFGREHGFAGIRTLEDFRAAVPLRRYEDLAPFVESAASGDPSVLTPGRPDCFCVTSGSAAPSKLIPHTAALRSEFLHGVDPWICDMFLRRPSLLGGRAYWCISPPGRLSHRTVAGIPLGPEDDTAYLGRTARALLGNVMAVPSEISLLTEMEAFRYASLAFLLAAPDLRLVSVWNPTFLSLLLEPLARWLPHLVADLRQGTLSFPTPVPADLGAVLARKLGRHPRRAAEIEALLRSGSSANRSLPESLWPRLALISCWTDAAARGPAAELQRLFPHVPIAGKGLVATEGLVSFPLSAARGAALAIRSHFYEFTPADSPDTVYSAWQLRQGQRYEVVITTGGGLYRYRLGDVVLVKGFYRQCPVIEFLGRQGRVADWYGEKLHEDHVLKLLERILTPCRESPEFILLAPVGADIHPDGYGLFLAGKARPAERTLEDIRRRLEAGLQENANYFRCRQLGQLQEVRVCWLTMSAEAAFSVLHARCLARGRKAGGIKPTVLDSEPIWERAFGLKNRS